ncbi:SET domain-containing protein 5 [Rhypophila decipiens]|uniref:SET domain-containing protein 5 n=1 Tax=Rhypophila decipiens TaxID=261697 RepID=A0AAN7B325_9PEZI|nr:SET domain-containing protein 5 [Rhypophila decipiens]
MHRLRLVLGLSTLALTTTAESLSSNSRQQAALSHLPPFGICHGITNDAASSICPVDGASVTNQSQATEYTTSDNSDKLASSPPPAVPQPDEPKKESKSSSPWSRGAICRRAGKDDFCAFTHSSFNNGEGISIITSPIYFVGMISQAPLSEPASAAGKKQPRARAAATEGPYKDVAFPGKGIGLMATEPIRAGRRIMARTPAVMVDDRAFRGLRRDDLALLLAQAILALPEPHVGRFLNLSSSHDAADASGSTSQSQMDLIYKIFTTNAFKTTVKVSLPDTSAQAPAGDGQEPKAEVKEIDFHSTFTEVSRLNHDCSPNLGYYFDTATLSHKVYAVKDILPGEELSVSYVDVLHPRETRQRLLQATWHFKCVCSRCGGPHAHENDDAHILAESDSRVKQINALRRELDNYNPTSSSSGASGNKVVVGSGTPAKALLMITLYELEGAQVRIYEAYYRAALEYNGVGDATNAMIYARLCLAKGLVARGPDRPFITSMKELIEDPVRHWSWRFRLGGANPLSDAAGKGQSEGKEEGK